MWRLMWQRGAILFLARIPSTAPASPLEAVGSVVFRAEQSGGVTIPEKTTATLTGLSSVKSFEGAPPARQSALSGT